MAGRDRQQQRLLRRQRIAESLAGNERAQEGEVDVVRGKRSMLFGRHHFAQHDVDAGETRLQGGDQVGNERIAGDGRIAQHDTAGLAAGGAARGFHRTRGQREHGA